MKENRINNIVKDLVPVKQEAIVGRPKTGKNNPTFRLVAHFKPGGKHLKWMWNSEWLLSYYTNYYGLENGTEIGAVRMKIQEVLNTTTRIVVYDNRSGKIPVLMEYINGKLRVDNTQKN